jgi:hypothetical protein
MPRGCTLCDRLCDPGSCRWDSHHPGLAQRLPRRQQVVSQPPSLPSAICGIVRQAASLTLDRDSIVHGCRSLDGGGWMDCAKLWVAEMLVTGPDLNVGLGLDIAIYGNICPIDPCLQR